MYVFVDKWRWCKYDPLLRIKYFNPRRRQDFHNTSVHNISINSINISDKSLTESELMEIQNSMYREMWISDINSIRVNLSVDDKAIIEGKGGPPKGKIYIMQYICVTTYYNKYKIQILYIRFMPKTMKRWLTLTQYGLAIRKLLNRYYL